MRLPAVACDVVKLSATRESQEFVSSRIGPVVVYTSRRFTRESPDPDPPCFYNG
jgi:hypothetical protein